MSDEKYVSGEEHVARSNSHKPAGPAAVSQRSIIIAAAVVVLCLLSFWGGVNYGKHHTGTSAAASDRSGSFGGGSGQRRGGGLGQVTAISDSSITVQSQRTGTSKTYSISSSTTTITDNGQTVRASDIKTGDTVIVMAASSGSTAASRILVNPSFGGGGQAGPSNTQSD